MKSSREDIIEVLPLPCGQGGKEIDGEVVIDGDVAAVRTSEGLTQGLDGYHILLLRAEGALFQ